MHDFSDMRVCGRDFGAATLGLMQRVIDSSGSLSRRALSTRICSELGWRSSNGRLQEGTCRKVLSVLGRAQLLKLPAVRGNYSFSHLRAEPTEEEFSLPEVVGSLSDLGSIEVVPIRGHKSKDARTWRLLISRYHYLGNSKTIGCQIRYLVRSSVYGEIGALSFSSGLLALGSRDSYIGWSESARRANIGLVVLNSRFLILPSVHVKNLASQLLSLVLRRLPQDWEQRYGSRPVLVETFVDPSRYDGASYRAANWVLVGSSAGRYDGQKKDLYLYPLEECWRERLCEEPPLRLGEKPREAPQGDWAREEFGTCRLYDPRLRQRLYTVATSFYNRPLANIPEASGSYANCKGTYRFFQNRKVTMDVVLTPHVESTIERIKEHSTVLAPQDTTTLNYTHPSTEGLGPTGVHDDRSVGMLLHETLAFTTSGVPLGIVDAQCWVRDAQDRSKAQRRKEVPVEDKESFKWIHSYRKLREIQKLCPQTMLVSIGDREADVFELFLETTKEPASPQLLVRCDRSHNRKIALEQGDRFEMLWTFMGAQDVAGSITIHIPKHGNVAARDATVQVRFSPIVLQPPNRLSAAPSINLWAVHLIEADNPNEEQRVEWMLLTTVTVRVFEDAVKMSEWYAGRWGIEVYHRTLKSGCRILDRQLGSADSLQSCLGVDMVVAWRVYHLTMLGREVPNHPCTLFFEDIEWKALYCYANKTRTPPSEPPSMVEAIRMVGQIGGHLGRKCDGMPGTQCIWRGLQRLDTAIDMYAVFTDQQLPKSRNSCPLQMYPPPGGT
jgi:hypothetical protein